MTSHDYFVATHKTIGQRFDMIGSSPRDAQLGEALRCLRRNGF